jgi:hypothetical protein
MTLSIILAPDPRLVGSERPSALITPALSEPL